MGVGSGEISFYELLNYEEKTFFYWNVNSKTSNFKIKWDIGFRRPCKHLTYVTKHLLSYNKDTLLIPQHSRELNVDESSVILYILGAWTTCDSETLYKPTVREKTSMPATHGGAIESSSFAGCSRARKLKADKVKSCWKHPFLCFTVNLAF